MPHMALELNKLMADVNALSGSAVQRLAEQAERLPVARAILNDIAVADDALRRKIRAAGNRWAGAIPTDQDVHRPYPLPPHPARANVLAADGSQIYPDRHGVALYYLVNVGSLSFRHGSGEAPITQSQPQVFFEDADLYDEDGGQISAQQIDVLRDVGELRELARLAQLEAASAPTLALLDNGLLLYISLQAQNRSEIEAALRPYLHELDGLKASGAAVAGVVDRPRAAGVLRLLHLHTLHLDEVEQHAERYKSSPAFRHLTDAMLFSFLQPGERSAVFENATPANRDHYQPRGHSVHFFYLNAGRPGKDALLRIEVPEWVAHNPDQLDFVHAAIVEQCRVSDGFPYVLMRAHELAVVTVAERRELEQLVVGALVRRGLQPSLSQKAQGKVWTGAGRQRNP
jgi:hypothetical protein